MKILDVLYYYYFLFYSKILKDDEPHLLATIVLSFSESLLLNYSIIIIGSHFYCVYLLEKWEMIGVIVILNCLNYQTIYTIIQREELSK